jgi:hypothetical protein
LTGDSTSYSGPEVRLWGVTPPSWAFQSEVVVHCVVEFLLAAETALSCLNRCVPKQKLNLFQVLRPPNGITVHRYASHAEQGP